ncbi:Zinc finger RING/FYVE/PHD-type protein [Dioscorea alata]|uniref:Zinc finger RING/FYVE/PHD-type protein n=1 Tax=Dioscorea alata TaxID=55571 RepID=A0ACB7TZQ2_DIOAL|nr:Zinc finger RING/FYVE/PHD-type protein [Dioscorea alata]
MSTTSSNECYKIVLPKPLLHLVHGIESLWFCISSCLSLFGFKHGRGTLLAPSWDHVYVNPLDHIYDDDDDLHQQSSSSSSSSLSPTTLSIKKQLKVVKFEEFMKMQRGAREFCEEEKHTCAVCLGSLEKSDEVRELGNCKHGFHKQCIDKWVDLGHLSCPLCRSHLLLQGHLPPFFAKLWLTNS